MGSIPLSLLVASILSRLAYLDRDLTGEQIRDFVIGQAGLAQDSREQSRRRAAHGAIRLTEPHRRPGREANLARELPRFCYA
jgi:hypothetical protein